MTLLPAASDSSPDNGKVGNKERDNGPDNNPIDRNNWPDNGKIGNKGRGNGPDNNPIDHSNWNNSRHHSSRRKWQTVSVTSQVRAGRDEAPARFQR